MNELVHLFLICGTLSLVIGLLGFVRTVWFISISYTASIAVFCSVTTILFQERLQLPSAIQLTLLFIWAVRLGWYILRRESNPRYREIWSERTKKAQNLSLMVKIQIWWSVSLLYLCMFTPAALSAMNQVDQTLNFTALAGLLVMGTGLVLEMAADYQKSAYKQHHPDRCITTGLYKWVCRYPNYLGEILVWFGSYMASLHTFYKAWHWILSSIGLVCICLIMAGSAKRLEQSQSERYGRRKSFQTWTKEVPVLLPLTPVYSLQNIRVFLE